MTRTREENARDMQLEALQKDLSNAEEFQCTECECVLDIEESIEADGELICELCDEQVKANGSAGKERDKSVEDESRFFGFRLTVESFGYLNEDREERPITTEQVEKGLDRAANEFRNNHYRLKEQFFEFVLDLCEGCIWDVADEAGSGTTVVESKGHESLRV